MLARASRPAVETAGDTETIVVTDLVKRYKGAELNAVDGISFAVRAGELFALLGPNGAGKTTTISILTTTLAPTSGLALIGGHDLTADPSGVRRAVGIIFQKPSLDLNLTAEENVRLHAILYGLYPYRPFFTLMPLAYRDRVRELSAILGIEKEMFKPVKAFSGGMKRKLEIVRSLMHRPRVLFLDEPTAGLDAPSRRALWDYLREVRAETRATVFLTTHYLDEAEDADRICILDKGKVVVEGTPAGVKRDLTHEYLVIDAADRDALRRELVARAIVHRETPLFEIPLDGLGAHALLKSIDTPLTTVRTVAPSLEDAYIKVLARS
ncbi:MAG TPA: ABC transporter ATP-binding protein [Candidatus Limnocylindria bacterium]